MAQTHFMSGRLAQRRTHLLASTIIAATATVAIHGGARAQTSPAGEPSTLSEITITGSRIRQPNLTAVSPLTVVTDEEIKLQGAQNIENLLNAMPQTVAGQQSNVAAGASGTATVNLRDLGAQRTLVLVDGHRLMPGDPLFPLADLNNIPSAMIDRVDVVTGGASAVYGADAVAGVVNFIMKKNFSGVRLDVQGNWLQHRNNDSSLRAIQGTQGITNYPLAPKNFSQNASADVSLIVGANAPDGKGNFTGYATYRRLAAIAQDKFDYSACSLAAAHKTSPVAAELDGYTCSGSSNSAYGRFTLVNGSQNVAGVTKAQMHLDPAGTQTFITTSVPAFNFAPLNYFQRPEERYTAGFNGHYEFDKHLEVYADFMFADDHTEAQIAPSALFAGGGANGNSFYQINCNNPLMSGQQKTSLCGVTANTAAIADVQAGFRFVGFNRVDDLRHTNYRVNVGARGEIGGGWAYDVYAQYGTSLYSERYVNDVSVSKIQNALLVDPVTGKCFTDSRNCVPLNIFQFGKLTADQANYVLTPAFSSGSTTEQIVSASVTGDLGQYGVKSPYASDGLGVAFGSEYRRESLVLNVDNEYLSGDLSGGPRRPNQGSFDVYEVFGEARAPLVQDQPFFKSVSLAVGYRYSDYSLSGKTDTYKVEGDWAVNSDLRFRAGYNRAVRAPNIVELFSGQQHQDVGASDPCAGQIVFSPGCIASFQTTAAELGISAATLAARFAGGAVTPCISGLCSAQVGGNKALKPEKADTFTAGFVFTPTMDWLRGFSLSVDYFDIDVKDVISAPNAQAILTQCVNGAAAACALVHRDPASGVIYGGNGYIIDQQTNGGLKKTRGFDLSANYRFVPDQWDLPDFGVISLAMVGTYTDSFETQPIEGGPSYDCAGLYGVVCGVPLPRWKHRLRLTWEAPSLPVNLSLNWRYVGRVKLDANQSNPLLANHPSGITDTIDDSLPAFNYFDLAAQWKVRQNFVLRAGVNNIFDKDPPVVDANDYPVSVGPYGNGNTFPGVYDSLGRTIFASLTYDF